MSIFEKVLKNVNVELSEKYNFFLIHLCAQNQKEKGKLAFIWIIKSLFIIIISLNFAKSKKVFNEEYYTSQQYKI